MIDHDNRLRTRRSYEIAFKIGAVGSIILAGIALLGPTLPGLLALVAWSMITLFVLPWLYICYCKREITIPYQLLRGPHQ